MLHTLRFSLQNAIYFIMLPFWFMYYSHFTYRVSYNLNVKLRCQKVKAFKPETQLNKCLFRESPLSWNSDSVLNLDVTSELSAVTVKVGCNLKISCIGYGHHSSGIFVRLLEPWRWKY